MTPGLGVAVSRRPLPDDLVPEILGAQNLVQDCSGKRRDVPIEVDIHAASGLQQLGESDCRLIKPGQVPIKTTPPGVAVSLLLDNAWFFREGTSRTRHRSHERKVRASGEGRI